MSLDLKDLLVKSLRTNDLVRDPSLRSGFRQRAPASLTPAKRLNLTFQRALKMGLGQLRGPSWLTDPPRNCPNQISIVTRYGSYVNGFRTRVGCGERGLFRLTEAHHDGRVGIEQF